MASKQRVHIQFVEHVAESPPRQRPQRRFATERVVDLIDLTRVAFLAAVIVHALDHGTHGGLELPRGGADHGDVLRAW